MPQLKEYYHDVDLKANQLFNSRLHNITTAARVALGLGLTTNSKGYQVYDTDLSTPYFWDGVQWNAAGGGGGTWGSITGIITAQTDLTTYLSTNYYPLSSNPAGYLTSSALTPYLTSATAASTYVPLTRNLTINGTTYDLSADRTWTVSSPLAWLLAGNSGTTPGTDFIGTTDNVDLIFKTNNTEQLKITTWGLVQTPGVIRAVNSTPVYVGAIDFTGNNGFSTIGWDSTNKGYLNLSNGLYRTYLRGTLITGSDKVHDLPNANGTLVMSVNGVYALSDGSVSIPTGSGTVTQVDTSAPLTGGPITTTGTIGISQATTSSDGYLSSVDWNIFNGKLGSVPNLQQVTDIGNTTTTSINLKDGTATNIISELGTNSSGGFFIKNFGQDVFSIIGIQFPQYDTYFAFGDLINNKSASIDTTKLTGNVNYYFPNNNGILALSVNGNFADDYGEITIPVGTGTVTSVGAGTGMNFTAITTSGNVDIDTAKVPYYATTPSNGLLKYTSGTWGVDTNTYLTTISGITAGGDLQGTYPNPTVHQIQGQSVQNGAPTNQDLLIWDNSASMWKHQQISTITGYNNTNWDTAYTNRITSLTTTGSSGSATLSSNTLNVPTYTLSGLGGQPLATNLTSLAGLSYASASFVKMSAAGTFSLDTNTYLTSVGTGTINELTYWSGANTLGSLTTGTYPSLAELSYVKGTTSSIQTQINNKGYSINFGALQTTIAASTTYYFGMTGIAGTTTANVRRVYIPLAGTIKEIYFYIRSSVTSSENWTVSLRLNNTTNTTIATIGNTSGDKVFSNSNLNVTVVAGDYFEITTTTPAWVTPASNSNFYGTLIIH